jgi:phenylpropionate dioxygenase-like ring-hydroxylating dioxygenase large terminal subunit
MTTAIESEELTRTGPGTPMGELMRYYWIPAALSRELQLDGAPVRLMLLGEKLIAFRDTAGRVGVMDHRCPHRCASLFLGRNEDGGIRCIYHGWKYDVAGNCVDMPSLPPRQDFSRKVKAKAYRTVERCGLVWVYMGNRAEPPPLPALEILDVPDSEIGVSLIMRECNYLQALEGDIDTSHFGFLHAGHVDPRDVAEHDPFRHVIASRAPEYHVADTPWGTQYAAYRPAAGGGTYWRFGSFMFPFWSQQPSSEFATNINARAWVPLDDGHTMFFFLWWKPGVSAMSKPQPVYRDGQPIGGTGRGNALLPNTTDWLGRFRMEANPGNDWQIDRAAQQDNRIYSGIEGVHLQDQAITESMGPITDHGFEHLAPSDHMFARTRRRLLNASRALRDKAVPPPGADDASVFGGVRSGFFVSDDTAPWQDIYARQLATSVRQAPAAHRAAE